MKEQLEEIMNTFGIKNQLKKLQEEVDELKEAITLHEIKKDTVEHITEEMADVMVLINQISIRYEISRKDVQRIALEKTARTINRINEGYYGINK